ncbi:ankyrin repeat domain-containing protein 61-like [Anguilla rostrata]|uniref:ankyrin repeat domain-containing protein 61-like n=1 Tax=Anguilla rostrata TaxID=7938 RepID=UPI0030CAD839
MHLAVRYGALPAVGILASHGARVNTPDGLGMLPLHVAAAALDADMAASLVAQGADVNAAVPRSGSTALHMAVLAALSAAGAAPPAGLSCVGLLLGHGAAPNARDGAGRTPLHQACQDGREEAADVLLRHGADVNVPTSLGENCLFLLLDRTANLERASLLCKVLGLTYPLSITNSQGALPRALLLPEHQAQRDLLLQLCQHPLSLQDTCRIHIHRQYGERSRPRLREMLPEKLHSFLYSSWKCPVGISFPGMRPSVDNQTAGHLPRTPADVNTVEVHATAGHI